MAIKIHWILGPRLAQKTGVGLFSQLLIEFGLGRNFNIVCYYFGGRIRSVRRYWDQYIRIPVRLLVQVKSNDLVVLYQEDVAFLAFFARIRTKKVILIVHHMPESVDGARFIDKLKSRIVLINLCAIKKARLVICPSETTAKLILGHSPKASVHVVENAFKTSEFRFNQQEARYTLGAMLNRSLDEKFVILNVGSEETRKNIAVLIDGLELLSRRCNFIFIKIGRPIDKVNREIHKEKLKKANFDYEFLDEVPNDILSLAYSAADLFVSPSLMEGFGRTVIEAQAAGVPVCASSLSVFDETMERTYFPVKRPEEPESWCSAVDSLIENESLRKKLAKEGVRNAQRYDISVVGERFTRLLDSVANG